MLVEHVVLTLVVLQTAMVWVAWCSNAGLALSLAVSLDYWWPIQSIAFGVVMFSLFVQAPTLSILASGLRVKE